MAARTCPQCMAKVPAGCVVAFTDGFDCPGCQTRLEVSTASRFLATLAGLLAAVLIWRLTGVGAGSLGWAAPVLYTFLGFSIVAPLALIAIADLRIRPPEPLSAPAAAGSHGSHH